MTKIPDPRGYAPSSGTWIDHTVAVAGDHCTMTGDHGQQEQSLLLAVLKAADGYDGDPDAYDHAMTEALLNVRKYAPHLIEAAKQEPTNGQ